MIRKSGPCRRLLGLIIVGLSLNASAADLIFCCNEDNDLYRAYVAGGGKPQRVDIPAQAIDAATTRGTVLILADDYPTTRTAVDADFFEEAESKHLKLYIEFPTEVPGVEFGAPQTAHVERMIIATDAFGDALPKLSILGAHSCTYLPTTSSQTLMALGRVAGYDTAVFGIPQNAASVLFEVPRIRTLIATTKLSDFRKARFAPVASWNALWIEILERAHADGDSVELRWTPITTPSYSTSATLPAHAARQSFHRAYDWYINADLFPSAAGEKYVRAQLADKKGTAPLHAIDRGGDGSHGILEGFESTIQSNGSQYPLIPLRADCIAETAMLLSLCAAESSTTQGNTIATNLLNYIFRSSGLVGGERADPASPAYGLIGWGVGSPAWETANYGDDNARTILASLAVAAELDDDTWNEQILRAVLANYRTTGKRGFRNDRIDMPDLLRVGWKHYYNSEIVNHSPHFEAYLWACYLWGYHATGHEPLLERARTGIGETMRAFPNGWRWNDMIERGHMLLPLAWLVRVDDRPEHREWLDTLVTDLLRDQQPSGALPEREHGGAGHYQVPKTNEEYGTAETPLIQEMGDPATDQLYTTGFALLGLHEAVAVTSDTRMKAAEDKLAEYLIRIQTQSDNPALDGVWFRAFDYKKWDYWASSADMGWGAWVIETGWGQPWIATVLALREKDTTLWDHINQVDVKNLTNPLLTEMELDEESLAGNTP